MIALHLLAVSMVPLSLQTAPSVVVCIVTCITTTKTNLINPSGASESRFSRALYVVVTLSTDL